MLLIFTINNFKALSNWGYYESYYLNNQYYNLIERVQVFIAEGMECIKLQFSLENIVAGAEGISKSFLTELK